MTLRHRGDPSAETPPSVSTDHSRGERERDRHPGTPARLALAALLVLFSSAAWADEKQGASSSPITAATADPRLKEPAGPPRSGADLEQATEELASVMRCPVCQGLSIADSPSESAMAMKAQVRKLLELGYSKDQVIEYFEGSYGEFVRLVPKVEGLNLLVWAAPALALIGGAALITWNRKAASGDPDLEELERYRAQVRREL